MAEKSFPLENTVYTAEDASLWFATRTSGVHAANELGVTAADGMTVNVGTGVAWLKYADFAGVSYANTEIKTLQLATANANYPRIDRIVIRYSKSENRVYVAVKSGAAATNPSAPDVTRNSDAYEISLARIRVNAGVDSISAYDIIDERVNNEVCGLMTDGVTPFDPEMGGVIIDETLKKEGAAADAAAVGERFGNMLIQLQNRALKTHAENHRCTDTITWDGSTEGLTTVEWVDPEYGDTFTFARVWDGEIQTELLSGEITASMHDPEGMLIPDEEVMYEYTKYRFEAVGDGAYIIKGTYYAAILGELEEDDFGFIYAGYYTTKPNTTVHLYEGADITLPGSGIYFTKYELDGNGYHTTSLTIPNHDFGNSTDPLTPEMISAAPKYHASETDVFGVADSRLYGHVKNSGFESAIYMGDESKGQDRLHWYNGGGEVVANDMAEAYELLLGKSIGAPFFWVIFNTLFSMEFSTLIEEFSDLYKYCEELDERLSALGG